MKPRSTPEPRRTVVLLVALSCVAAAALLPAGALAQSELTGTTPGGALYSIQMPAAWNGQLVIWNHGFELGPPQIPDVGVFADIPLSEGFAVAASSYRQPGWAVFKTVPDMQELMAVFRQNYGEPSRIYLVGASLGGVVTQQLIEKAGLGNVEGALILCGAVAGSRNWDAALDLRLAYDAVCGEVAGGTIPGGAYGLPKGSDLTPDDVEGAVNACTGVDLPPGQRTSAQRARLQQLLGVTGVAESFLQTDMWYVTFGMADLVWDRAKMRGKLGTDNARVTYPDPQIDASIERVTARAGKKRRLQKNYTPKGNIGETRIIAMHTDKDNLVVVENVGDLQAKVPADQFVAAVVVEDEPSHCGFTAAEALAGWESLRSWVDAGTVATAESIQSRCQLYEVLLGVDGPCRFDPDFEIGDLDDRILPRQ